jgi:hypothetical protein
MSIESGKYVPSEEELKEAASSMTPFERVSSQRREYDITHSLSKDEYKLLEPSNLKLLEHDKDSTQYGGFEGTIDGKHVKTWHDRDHYGEVFATVDGVSVDNRTATMLYNKYGGVAEAQTKAENWESDSVRAEALTDGLFRRDTEELYKMSELRLSEKTPGRYAGFEGTVDGKQLEIWINKETDKVEGTINDLPLSTRDAERLYNYYSDIAEEQTKAREKETEEAKKQASVNSSAEELLNL